jgi:hypothetical protein
MTEDPVVRDERIVKGELIQEQGTAPTSLEGEAFVKSFLTFKVKRVTIGYLMLTRSDITAGTYLRLKTSCLGKPAGLIGTVYTVGTDQTGEWYFQLRYVNTPPGTRTRAGSP